MTVRGGIGASWLRTAGCVLAGSVILAAQPCRAGENYPTRGVRIIVPYPPGGTADLLPRLVGERLSRKWGQPVTIDNRSGAGGNIGADAFAKADPDGYTLLASPPAPLVINQNLYARLTFDPGGFVPITILARAPNALVANPRTVTADSVAALIADARARPGKITSATQGNGTTSHLTSAMFQMMAQVTFLDVPYRGSAPALQGLVAGNVDIMFDNLGTSLPLVKGGALKPLGVATETRLAVLPDVPTIAETLPGFASSTWFAVVAPARTPRGIVDILNADIAEALRAPDIAQRLAELLAEPVGDTPEATAATMRADAERWNQVIKSAGIRVE
jgi:tripartite-type tricarboxylate transporter receptor subunit TctC